MKRYKYYKLSSALVAIITMALLTLACGKTIYVDDDAAGANNGSSWENAYVYLQEALADANESVKHALSLSNGPVEIRVAKGIYTPDKGKSMTAGDRDATFKLINGVFIRGGFAGLGEIDPNSRDLYLHETILSGDLSMNDVLVSDPKDLLDESSRGENSYSVVTANDTSVAAVLDGFIITGGNANASSSGQGAGGGIYCYDRNVTSPILDQAIIMNCIIEENSAKIGGGMGNDFYNPILINCIFRRNCSFLSGGGMNDLNSSPVLTNCIFSGNVSMLGGGMYNFGVGVFDWEKSNPILNNCTFSGNRGSGIDNDQHSSSFLSNCILWGNVPGQISSGTVKYSNVQGGIPGLGNIDVDPLFADPNNSDYHLKSQIGRYDPNSGSWVKDDVTSPCIDAGDPNSDYSGETWPHGGRINMGAYGGTQEASMSLETQGLFLPRVAYFFSHRIEPAESFDFLLETYGCSTTLFKLNDVPVTSLDSYDLIIVADDTQYETTWSDPNSIAVIENSTKPIIGLGDGGYDFFGLLGLSIGNPYGGHSSNNSIEVVDPNCSLFSTPYSIEIPQDRALQLYTETKSIGIYLWPTVPETVTGFGHEVNDVGYFPLVAEHNRYMLWGFTESPQKMTETGKKLFINVVIRTANNAW
jgi:hypothetical protein